MSPKVLPQKEAAARVALRGASFEAPSTWEEEAVLVFRAPGELPRPTVSVSRSKADQGGASLETMMAQRIAALSRILAGVEVEETRETTTLLGRAVGVRFTFEELEGTFVQRMTLVQGADAVYVLIGRSMIGQAMEMNAVFDHLSATFRPAPPATPGAR